MFVKYALQSVVDVIFDVLILLWYFIKKAFRKDRLIILFITRSRNYYQSVNELLLTGICSLFIYSPKQKFEFLFQFFFKLSIDFKLSVKPCGKVLKLIERFSFLGSNPCSYGNGGCRYLCFASLTGGSTCACPDNISEEECQRSAHSH